MGAARAGRSLFARWATPRSREVNLHTLALLLAAACALPMDSSLDEHEKTVDTPSSTTTFP